MALYSKYILLDVLLCSIAEYFYELCKMGGKIIEARWVETTSVSFTVNTTNEHGIFLFVPGLHLDCLVIWPLIVTHST